jgi:formate/nitrite transporter FocA (FNT family)
MSEDKEQEQEKEGQDQGGQQKKAEEAESLDAKTTYEVVRREGLRELERSSDALFWSGLAAGLSMGFSFLTEALLRARLPETDWRPLVVKSGYSVGFLIVILGSQQLFTENTLTPMVPLLHEKTRKTLVNVLRLWGVVLLANLIGSLLFALALGKFEVVEPQMERALSEIAAETLRFGASVTFLHAIYAGWLVALMVWMLPAAETAKPLIIIVMTYLIGIGGFAHIIAGSTEVFYAAVRHEATWGEVLSRYIFPTLLGNIVGGVTLVAALNHAQATSGEE